MGVTASSVPEPMHVPAARDAATTILVVDDDALVRRVLVEGLAIGGWRVVECASGEQALEQAERESPDLILCDVHLPGIDGVEVTRRLKAEAGSVDFLPVMIIAGVDAVSERVRAFRGGCDDFMGKPIDLFELRARVTALLHQRAQHEQLRRANQQLRGLHRKKQVLAALVVHDLRNPLSAIQGNVEMLREELSDAPPFVTEILDDLRTLSLRTLSLVAGLLDVEELEEGLLEASPIDLGVAEFLHQAAASHWGTIRTRGLSLVFEAASDLRARIDPDLTGRLVENLLDNAVRYAPRKGRVVMRATMEQNILAIRVGNNGPPVPEAERDAIFGRYYRIEARRAGARANRGLGLYFCKLAAEAHGGSIEIEEQDPLAACFVVRIPQAPVEPSQDPAKAEEQG